MKRSTTLFTVALIATSFSVANGQAKIELGIKGGWNFATLTGVSSVTNGTKNKSGYHVGAYTLFRLSKIGIQPEILYSQQGEAYSYSGSNYGTTIDYMNIPVMVKVYLAEGLNLHAGPQIGFITKAIGSLRNINTGAVTTEQNVKDYLNSTEFSIGVGLGWDLLFGLNLGARYNIGLSDVNKYTNGTPPNNLTTSMGTIASRNNVFQLFIGYRIMKLVK